MNVDEGTEPTDGIAPPGEDEVSRVVRLLRGLAERTFRANTVAMLQDAASLIESLQLGTEIAYQREPTQKEGDAHEWRYPTPDNNGGLGGDGGPTRECFVPIGGWTGNRCRHCSKWVWGGPTTCQGCIAVSCLTEENAYARAEYDRGRREGRADVGKYANAIERIDCALERTEAMPLDETVKAVKTLALRADTDGKAKAAWEQLYNERNRLWRDAQDKLDLIRGLLERNGCDCDCGHDSEGHEDDCDRCLACRISGSVCAPPNLRSMPAERERDTAIARAVNAECERDACRGMEIAAEARGERLFRDREATNERARRATQILVAEIGADAPMNVEEAAKKAAEMICSLQWEREMTCENTPNPGCHCPGCQTARERAEKGEAVP